MTASPTARRIDQLTPGAEVTLRFAERVGSREEAAVLVQLSNDGGDRRAMFVSVDSHGKPFSWEAYRYNGSWVYGSSAQRLSLVTR